MSTSAPSRDANDLAAFGYQQRLNRRLSGFSSFAVGFSYLSILTGLPQLFYLGFGAGGPAFFWTWPLVYLGQLLVALCFAELAATYPLSGGVYQWSKRIGSPGVGWMAGWIYLACATISLAAVALAPQATLTRIVPGTQVVGDSANPVDAARNAVLLGSILIAMSTAVNAIGVRLLSRINNVGVFAEIGGVILLIVLLAVHARRGFSVLLETQSRGEGQPLGYLSPFLSATLTACYVMYGFDAAGSLAEETENPRKRAPRAILGALTAAGLAGALLILGALLAAEDLADPALGKVVGGMPAIIEGVLGDRIGLVLLVDVLVAIAVCTLTVHASAARLVFAMARDNTLPFSKALARIPESSQTPILPVVLLGIGSVALLAMNANVPQIIEVMTSVAVVWANLAYLFVTGPMLLRRLRGRHPSRVPRLEGGFTLGRWGLPVNLLAVVWGLAVVGNVGWPRPEIYGTAWYRLYSAPLVTAAMVASGALYYGLARRRRTGVLDEHRATVLISGRPAGVSMGEELG